MTIISEKAVSERSVSVEWITPALAAEYLTHNIANNRRPKPTRIAAYTRDIQNGNWLFTGEAIKFDIHGHLVDGQNRLHAIINADMPAEVLVIRGLTPEAVNVLDSGMSRSGADAITISGIAERSDPKDLAATVRLHLAWQNGDLPHAGVTSGGLPTMTKTEMIEYIGRHPRLDFAARYGRAVYANLRLPVGSLAVAWEAFERIDIDDTAEFFNRIRDGISTGIGDPFLTLSRRVVSDRNDGLRSIPPARGLFYLFRTWNAFRGGEILHKLQAGSRTSGFTPIPVPR
jgi:hypothetical protein